MAAPDQDWIEDVADGKLSGGRRTRVFLECTYTYTYGGNSGIQRVVRNIINNAQAIGRQLGVRCQPVVWTGSFFQPMDKVSAKVQDPQWLVRRLMQTFPPPMKELIRQMPFKKRLKGYYNRLAGWAMSRLRRLKGEIVEFRQGDVLFLLDFSWLMPIWPGVQAARRQQATIGSIIYDLVPIRLPQTCNQEILPQFQSWFDQACVHSDFFVAISRTVAQEQREYLAKFREGLRADAPVGSFQLGAGLDQRDVSAPVRAKVRHVFGGAARPYLIVATLEPRKNHAYLLDAFERVWARKSDAVLCIVGKQGWHCQKLVQRINEHPRRGRQLFMFNDLSDGELSFCYDHAKALVFPSIYEGFGLPIVEGLSKGCKVLASDIPIHRETGGEYCMYFDLSSPDSLAGLILDYETKGTLPPVKSAEDYYWPNWPESCAQLIRVLVEMAQAARKEPKGDIAPVREEAPV